MAEVLENTLESTSDGTSETVSEEETSLVNTDIEDLIQKIVYYCQKQAGVELYPYQVEYAERVIESLIVNDGEEITTLFSRQSGKCFVKGTEVLMYDGSNKKVEDIKVGDKVMGPNSKPRNILGLGRGKEELYEIRPKAVNQSSFTVNKSHILSLKSRRTGKICNISVEDYLKLTDAQKEDLRGWRVPVDFPHKEVEIDPYWFGLWIGDGSSYDVKITNNDEEIVSYLEKYAEELGLNLVTYTYKDRCKDYAITNEGLNRWYENGNEKQNRLRKYLKKKELIGNKYIPDEMLINSKEVRLKLLAGLIDSDGYKPKQKGRTNSYEIVSSKKELAEQIKFLCGSLGFRVSIKKSKTNKNTDRYRVSIYGDFSNVPIKVKRKQTKNNEICNNPLTFGFDVIYKGIGDYYGFTIDGDRLFLLKDFTVTHNTEAIAVVIAGLMVIIPKLAQMPEFEGILDQYKQGLQIGLFAPSREQAYTTFSRARERIRSENARMILNDPEVDTSVDKEGNPMILSNGSLLRMQSAAMQSQIESKTYHLVIAEEAQDIDRNKILKSVHPMLASTNGTIVKIGTPNNKKCEFLEAIRRNRRRDMNKKQGRKNHYEYNYKVAQMYNPRYKKYIDKEKKRLGQYSDEFRMSYNLEWLLERGMFLSPDMRENLYDSTRQHVLKSKKPCAVGIDIGKRNSSTVITVAEIAWDEKEYDEVDEEEKPVVYVLNWLELQGDDYENQYNDAVSFLENYNIVAMYIDATAVGSAMADRMIHKYRDKAHVEPYEFTTKSKSEMWKLFRREIQQGRFRVPCHAKTKRLRNWRKFEVQMDDLEKEWKNQNLVCQKPADDKDARDDFCDSAALCCMAAHHGVLPEVEEDDNPFF